MSREPPIAPPTKSRDLLSVQYDWLRYQKLRADGDVRSWAADQLHEDLGWLLDHIGKKPAPEYLVRLEASARGEIDP